MVATNCGRRLPRWSAIHDALEGTTGSFGIAIGDGSGAMYQALLTKKSTSNLLVKLVIVSGTLCELFLV